MRIALIAPQPFIDIRATSMENLRLSRLLADAGHTVDVLTYPIGDAPEHPGVNICRCRPVPGVRSVKIGFSGAKLFLDANLLSLAARLVRERRYHCIHGVEEGAMIGILARRKAGIPVIYDMDSVMSYEISAGRFGRVPFAAQFMRGAESWAIRNSEMVITISDAMADFVRRHNPSKEVVIVPDVPMPLPAGGADRKKGEELLPPCALGGSRIIMYTGSLAAYQGIPALVRAMPFIKEKASSAILVIAGGNQEEISRLSASAAKIGVGESVLFLGKVPPPDIPHLLTVADVLVSPRTGGINPPAKIYTYMQSGRPVVATDIPAHSSVTGRDAARLTPAEPRGIAEGILWVLSHPSEARRMAEAAKEKVRGLTVEAQTTPIIRAYERLWERLNACKEIEV